MSEMLDRLVTTIVPIKHALLYYISVSNCKYSPHALLCPPGGSVGEIKKVRLSGLNLIIPRNQITYF